MTLDYQMVERFAESLKSRGKQPATIESYCRDAQRFLDYLARYRLLPTEVEPATLMGYQNFLRSDLEERDNSVRRTVIGIRQFFRFLTESRAINSTPFDSVPIPARDEALGKGLTTAQIECIIQLASAGRPATKAARDAALVALLAYEGIKANELINLRWVDLITDGDSSSLHIGGARARSIRLSAKTLDLILTYRRHYLTISNPAILQSLDKRMFVSFRGRDATCPLPMMTRHGLKFILYEIGDKMSLSKLNTEQLRHYAVSYLIDIGRAPDEIMAHLGLRRLGNIAKHLALGRGVIVDHAQREQGALQSP